MLRRAMIAVLAFACLAAAAIAPAQAQAPQMPAAPQAAVTPPASVAEYQGASCLVGGATAAIATAWFSRGILPFLGATVAGCAVGWFGSPYLLTLWRRVQ